MAGWKKVIVSGSNAELNQVTASFFIGDGSALTGVAATSLDIDNFGSDLTSATLVGTDLIATSDNGTEGRASISQLASPLAGTGLEANSGTIRVAAAAAGNGLAGGGGSALSLDLNELTAATVAVANDSIAIIDADDNSTKKESIADVITATAGDGLAASSGVLSVGVDDSTIETNSDALRVKANGIGSNEIADDAVGSDQIANNAVALTTQTTGDYVQSLGSGTGVTIASNSGEGSSPTIAVDYGSTANTAVQGNTTITLTQTSGEIDITGTAAQALGGGPSYTIGLADTITGNRTFSNDVTITGDLTVDGTTTTLNTTNLNVEDKFILLNSGSNAADAGIVVNGQGASFGWDESENRWAFDFSGATFDQTTIGADAYASAVVTSDDANYRKNGNIRIDGEEIFIYTE